MLENGIVRFENLINLFIWPREKFTISKKTTLHGDCIIMKFLKQIPYQQYFEAFIP